jgi:hypothetical protein
MYTVAAHAESRLIVRSMYSPGLAPSGQLTSRTVPENMAPGLFRRAGWEQQKLNQFEMKIEF